MKELTGALMPHLMLAPIMLPLFSAALMLFLREERRRVKLGISLVSTLASLVIAVMLLRWTNQSGASLTMGVYLPGNWSAPFGISLAMDRLTAMMLVLGFIESLLPVATAVPGVKLGLSNGVLMFALYMLDAPTAFLLMLLKVVLSGLLFGGVSAMMYAMAGGVASMLVMILFKRFNFSMLFVSMLGAVAHNAAQVLLTMIVLHTRQLLYYLAVLTLIALVTGAVTGIAAQATVKHIRKLKKRG